LLLLLSCSGCYSLRWMNVTQAKQLQLRQYIHVERHTQKLHAAVWRLLTVSSGQLDQFTMDYSDYKKLSYRQQVVHKIHYKIAMSAGPIAPPYLAELCRPVVHLTGRRHLRSAASGNSMCNGQPQPLVAGTLLFPVWKLGTVYQLNCVCRHCPQPPLHDAWKRISSSALNDMCLQRIWFYLRLSNVIIIIIIIIITVLPVKYNSRNDCWHNVRPTAVQ